MVDQTLDNRLIRKLTISFFLILVLVGVSYVMTTVYFTDKFFEESTQKLNAHIANHLIDEKFQNASPFMASGEINKAFFGDLMHDMMAVNQGIEVYLLDKSGEVQYSVVLDHTKADAIPKKVDTRPINEFIASGGQAHILGDDPRSEGEQKIFSAAAFNKDGREGYIYIVLASQVYEKVHESLFNSYFLQLGIGTTILTIMFASFIGFFSIRYLTRNLREVIFSVRRFKEGDLTARIDVEKGKDLSVLTSTFNDMADTLVANIEQLKSVERLRRELIANISHDLRSPMAITQGYVETMIMKNDVLTLEDRDKYLHIMHNSMQKLAKLVSQLFEYSKLEADQMEPEKQPFQITELTSDVFANYQMLANNKGVELKLEVADKVPLVFADIALVERVFQNLIDNALKFTPKGGEISLQIVVNDSKVKIAIKNSGLGIASADQAYIFERYRQAEKNHVGGAGLGLAIVKKILDIHQSTIEVISKPNEGASFQFWLPVYQEV